MIWKSIKNEGIHKRSSENIYKSNSGPKCLAKLVKSPLVSFKFTFTDAMIKSIVQHTNNCIKPVLERFWVFLQAFIGILYLGSAFRLNPQSRETN